jgi:hypothetical protein
MNDATVTVSVSVPQALLFETGLSKEAAAEALLRAFVLSLYRQDRISSRARRPDYWASAGWNSSAGWPRRRYPTWTTPKKNLKPS